MLPRVRPTLWTLALVAAGAAPGIALRNVGSAAQHKDKADVCPYCKNDPALMKRAAVVSHGPIPIGPKGSQAIVASLPGGQWVFLETAHLRWASSLPSIVVDLDDKKRVTAELARLRELLPDVPLRPRKLDPYLRLHLFALKAEDLYARFQAILRVTDADFPEARTADKPFMGDGRYLGEKEKYEVVLHATRASHQLFTQEFAGAQVTGSLRYHFSDAHKILVSIPAEDHDLRQDKWLYPYVVHSLTHMMFCGYKHFSYDPPPWIDEGLACVLEKEIEPQSTTNEGEEGAMSDLKGPKDWAAATRKLLAAGKQSTTAELMRVKTLDGLNLEQRLTAWSMMRFLMETQPEPFAKLLGTLKGQLDERGYPSGKDLPDLTRRSMKELWSWTPVTFDEAWKAWALK